MAKIGYLIKNGYEDEDECYEDWRFYTEETVPSYILEYKSPSKKRIIYWEIEDESR